MADLLWVKMPSIWIAKGKLNDFSSSSNISDDIASLKIFISLCLEAKVVSHEEYSDFLKTSALIDRFETKCTYDELMEATTLSRSMISRGLKRLSSLALITREGTTRKKIYVINGAPRNGWCKLPKKALIKKGLEISAFTSFTQRYRHERDALKIFLYLIASRSNTKRFVDLSRGVITKQTGVKLADIDGALGFLRSVGLLEKIESRGYKKETVSFSEFEKLHRYWVVGNSTLNLRRVLKESEFEASS